MRGGRLAVALQSSCICLAFVLHGREGFSCSNRHRSCKVRCEAYLASIERCREPPVRAFAGCGQPCNLGKPSYVIARRPVRPESSVQRVMSVVVAAG